MVEIHTGDMKGVPTQSAVTNTSNVHTREQRIHGDITDEVIDQDLMAAGQYATANIESTLSSSDSRLTFTYDFTGYTFTLITTDSALHRPPST
jgi:hypothetical protein